MQSLEEILAAARQLSPGQQRELLQRLAANVPRSDLETLIADHAAWTHALAALPTSIEDEALVDQLAARARRPSTRRPLPKRNTDA